MVRSGSHRVARSGPTWPVYNALRMVFVKHWPLAAKAGKDSSIDPRGIRMDDQVDHSRRRLLTAATVGTGAIGVAFAAAPFPGLVEPEFAGRGARRAGRSRCIQARAGPAAEGRLARTAGLRRAPLEASGRTPRRPQPAASRPESATTRSNRRTSRRRCRRARATRSTGSASPCARTSGARRSEPWNRTPGSSCRASTLERNGREASIAPATAPNTMRPAGCSRICRRRRI